MKLPKFNIQYLILFSLLFCSSLKSFAQSEPTIEETAEWIHSKLITHLRYPKDNLQINVSTCTITWEYIGSDNIFLYCIDLSNLNANGFLWEYNQITFPAILGENAYKEIGKYTDKQIEKTFDKITFQFDDTIKNDNMKERFTKAMKLLIKQCGG